jgi:hypothetical protein
MGPDAGKSKLKQLLIIAMVVIMVTMTAAVAVFFSTRNTDKEYAGVIFSNSDKLDIGGRDEARLNFIKSLLNHHIAMALEYNGSPLEDDYVVSIRSLTGDKDIYGNYITNMIVDIPDIRQSWRINYSWDITDPQTYIGEPAVFCLGKKDMVYPDFRCEEAIVAENVSSADPIMRHLPYSTLHYTVTGDTTNRLKVEISLSNSDLYGTTSDKAAQRYENEVVEWIKSLDLDPNDYIINYIY